MSLCCSPAAPAAALEDDLKALLALGSETGFSPQTEDEAYRTAMRCAYDAGLTVPEGLPHRRAVLAWLGDTVGTHGSPPVMTSHQGRQRARAWAAAVLARRIITAGEDAAAALDAAMVRCGAATGAVHWRETDPAATSL